MKERSPSGFRSRKIVGRLTRAKSRGREKTGYCCPTFLKIYKPIKKENRKKIASQPRARDTFELKERVKVCAIIHRA